MPTEIPTSGGSSESETSEESVTPMRSPSLSIASTRLRAARAHQPPKSSPVDTARTLPASLWPARESDGERGTAPDLGVNGERATQLLRRSRARCRGRGRSRRRRASYSASSRKNFSKIRSLVRARNTEPCGRPRRDGAARSSPSTRRTMTTAAFVRVLDRVLDQIDEQLADQGCVGAQRLHRRRQLQQRR